MDGQQLSGWGQVAVGLSALIFTMGSFWIDWRRRNTLRLETEAKALDARKIEIYQRLEIESNRVFEFETANASVVTYFKDRMASVDSIERIRVSDGDGYVLPANHITMTARKYYEMNCNLFEIAARLRRHDLVDHDVFGSWVAWYFDTACEWGFRALWNELRDNYTSDLRGIFDDIVIELIEKWDLSPAAAKPDDAVIADIRRRFYAHVAKRFDCAIIATWLQDVEQSRLPVAHPLAYG